MDNSKELELKEKELALKEKELELKEKASKRTPKAKPIFTALIILSLLAISGFLGFDKLKQLGYLGTDNSKELELKEKELALKEKELELKEDSSSDGSEKFEETEGDSEKGEKTEKTKETKTSEKTASVKKLYTPKEGSSERTQILDVIRDPVQKEFNIKQNVTFKVVSLKVLGDWAFIRCKASGQHNYKGTKYESSDPSVYALLKKRDGKWTINTKINYTKTFFNRPPMEKTLKKYGAPLEILP